MEKSKRDEKNEKIKIAENKNVEKVFNILIFSNIIF